MADSQGTEGVKHWFHAKGHNVLANVSNRGR
jgi:hypothetical protein